ncbi:MAG: CBS domain-containing protein [Candidatus Roizmanbacteria bacterium]|nr:CBS domain-containing protein [Candidatus Roizmanbacteria bacterium]
MKHIEEILKKSKIIKVSPDDTLSSALGKLKSSHDAAFVFDTDQKFLGVINPYYTLIKSSAYDGSTKVEHVLFHPPHISTKDSLSRIVKLMNESKIHYLPVFDDKEKFIGITSARRILMFMKKMDASKITIGQMAHTQKGKVITVELTDPISKAQTLFKEYKTSKIVVVDAQGRLKGILSNYDLIPYILAPGSKSHEKSRGGSKSFKDTPIKNYAKTTVLTLSEKDTVSEAIEQILSKEIGSIILVNPESHPVGIVTTRDIFDLLRTDSKRKRVKITTKHLSKRLEVTFEDFTKYITEHIQSNDSVVAGSILFEGEKNDALFKIAVHLQPQKGDPLVITREGKDFSQILQEVKDVVRRG